MSSYLFILSPQYSGSTVLWKVISTSDAVSSFDGEGQFLPEVREVMRRDPWNAEVKLPWPRIKEVWDGYWDHEKPLLLEKSPPNLIRAAEIEKVFRPISFLLMVRNPYAHCEGLMRRGAFTAETAARHTLRCLRQQAANAASLKSTLRLTYEELTADPEATCRRIEAFVPSIGKLQASTRFKMASIDGMQERGIVDINPQQIANLSRHSVAEINRVLEPHGDVLEYWGYRLFEPPLSHTVAFIRKRGKLVISRTLARGRNRIAKLTKPAQRRA